MNRFPLIVAAPIALWAGFEIALALRDRFRGRGKLGNDKGSSIVIRAAFYVGFLSAAFLSRYERFAFPLQGAHAALWAGLAIMGVGIALRVWAVATLGASFRLTVETHQGQAVVDRGPYRLVRHPSYGGLILVCLGWGVGLQSWLSIAAAVVFPTMGLLYRIHVEEHLLASRLGEDYRRYQDRTKKLIPWIW